MSNFTILVKLNKAVTLKYWCFKPLAYTDSQHTKSGQGAYCFISALQDLSHNLIKVRTVLRENNKVTLNMVVAKKRLLQMTVP